MKEDKFVANAACTHDVACLRLSDATFIASSDIFSSWSEDEDEHENDILERASETKRALFKLACSDRN